jgi:anthranilate phosphoribosyltransferase
VVAGAGVPVAKHGNRAVSSSCGSADVLEALGVDLAMAPEMVSACVKKVGIGFLFAPMLHKAMKYAIRPRRELGIRTIFNILGPMTNPAGANVQLTGVFAKELTVTLAEVLAKLGMKRTLVVWGEGNLDEMTITGTSFVAEVKNKKVTSWQVTPEEVGLKRASITDISGGTDALKAAALVRSVLAGEPGARLDMVLLNSGAALMAADKVDTLYDGVEMAREIVSSGKAATKLEDLLDFCKYSASTPSSPHPTCSHMSRYSSQDG